MLWNSLLFLFVSLAWSQEPPRFLTKHTPESLRYVSMDGRVTYVQKKPGVLGFVGSFKSVDFLSDSSGSDILVVASPDRIRLAIEVVPNAHTEYNMFKNHKLFVVNYGNTQAKEVGKGRAARLHLKDEWLTSYDAYERVLNVQNLPTGKTYQIRLSNKSNPFFVPEAVMVAQDNVTYTDINENGYAALISYNLATKASSVIYRASQTGTKLELCRNQSYLAIGEFPYEGLTRGSKIMHIKIGSSTNLAGYSTIYNSVDPDVGNMVCLADTIYFVKTFGVNKNLTTRTTDAVRLDIKSQKIEQRTTMGNVSQLVEMDERVLVPFRGEFLVVEGNNNLGIDTLKATPKEELPLDI